MEAPLPLRHVRQPFAAAILLAALLLGCNGGPRITDPSLSEAGADEAPLRTDRTEYHVTRSAHGVLEVRFGVRYSNQSSSDVHIPSCHGPYPPIVEKLVGDEWVNVYVPMVPLCLGPPLVVERGMAYEFTYVVPIFPRGGNNWPQFETDTIPGTYRLRWMIPDERAVAHDVVGSPMTGLLSNEFQLIE